MIITLTANPSVDRTIEVAALRPGTVIRARASRVDAGGKGVNVARALAAHGRKATAVLPSGGAEGAQLEALLAGSGLDLLTVRIADSIRANVTVVEADGTTTKLNEPGPRLSGAELDALAASLIEAAASHRVSASAPSSSRLSRGPGSFSLVVVPSASTTVTFARIEPAMRTVSRSRPEPASRASS